MVGQMSMIDAGILDIVAVCRGMGLLGFALYVLGFLLLSTGHITSETHLYFALNLLAALCVIASLAVDFNLSSALIQGFYVLISLIAMAERARRGRAALTV